MQQNCLCCPNGKEWSCVPGLHSKLASISLDTTLGLQKPAVAREGCRKSALATLPSELELFKLLDLNAEGWIDNEMK